MPKQGTIEQIKEYNKHKQAWSRTKKKGISLTWGEYCSEKSLTHLLELKRNVKLSDGVKPQNEICQTSLEEKMSNLVKCQTSNLSNLIPVKPEPNLSNLEKEGVHSELSQIVKPANKSLTSENLTERKSIECQTTEDIVKLLKVQKEVKPKEDIHKHCQLVDGRWYADKWNTSFQFIQAHRWYEGKKDQYWSYFGCKNKSRG